MIVATRGAVEGLEEFLAISAVADRPLHEVLETFGERARKAFGAVRIMIGWRLLNPLFISQSLYWRPETGVTMERWRVGEAMVSDAFLASPIHALLESEETEIRARLDRSNTPFAYPILETLAAEGCTDYFISKVGFGHLPTATVKDRPGSGVILSFTSEREGGFNDDDMTALRRLQYMLALTTRSAMERDMRETLAATYLGGVAGERVLKGEITRGQGETINALIWYCDMRGSTELCEALGVEAYIPVLNAYFSATAGPVKAAGGNVLDFIGDAVLAIFPLTEAGLSAASAATEAVIVALERLRESEPAFAGRTSVADMTGIALATGPVVYGNIGIPERLTFSVIGPTVNAVARLENLTKTLREPVLATADAAARLAGPGRRAMGEFVLPGQRAAQTVYALNTGGR
ncbi:MAG: adenylate/guanylate cyclase domain-containing protein [Pseudomonadota bacterium]